MIKYISALFASDCIPRGLLRAGPRNLRINAPLLAAGMVCLILLSVAGCASTKTRYIKAYDGPERTLEEIAVVKCSPGVGVRIPLRLDTGGDIKVGDMYPDRGDGGVWLVDARLVYCRETTRCTSAFGTATMPTTRDGDIVGVEEIYLYRLKPGLAESISLDIKSLGIIGSL